MSALLNACLADDPEKIRVALAAGEPVSLREIQRATSQQRRHAVENLRVLWSAWQKSADTEPEAAEALRKARVDLVQGWAFPVRMNLEQNWSPLARARLIDMAKIIFSGAADDAECFAAVGAFPDGSLLAALMQANGLKHLTLDQLHGVLQRVRVTREWVPVIVGAIAHASDTVVSDFLHRSMDDPEATAALLKEPRCREALMQRPEFFLKCAVSLARKESVDRMLRLLESEGMPGDELQALAHSLIRSIWNQEILRDDAPGRQLQADIIAMLGRTTGCRLDGECFEGRRDSRLVGVMRGLAALGGDVPELPLCEASAVLRENVQAAARRSGFEIESDTELVFSTREDGDVGAGRAGQSDIERGRKLAERVSEIVGCPIVPEVVDEWVLVSVPESAFFECAEKTIVAASRRPRASGMSL